MGANRCHTCRKRKTRCDGERPVCRACKDNGHDCLGYANSRRAQAGSGKPKSAKPRVAEQDVEDSQRDAQASVSPQVSVPLNANPAGVEVHEQDGSTYPELYHDNMSSTSQERRHAIDGKTTKLDNRVFFR